MEQNILPEKTKHFLNINIEIFSRKQPTELSERARKLQINYGEVMHRKMTL